MRSSTVLLGLFATAASGSFAVAQTPTISGPGLIMGTTGAAPVGINGTATSGYPEIQLKTGNTSSTSAFRVFNSASSELFRVQSDGYVGIGLSSLTATSRLTIWDGGNTLTGQRLAIGFTSDYGYSSGRNPNTGFLENIGSDTGYGESYKGFTFNSRVGIGTQSSFTAVNGLLELDPVQLPTSPIASLSAFAGKGILLQGPGDSTDGSQMGIMSSFGGASTGIGAGIIFARHGSGWGTRIQFHTHSPSTVPGDMDKEPEVMRIDEDGRVGIGLGNTAPIGLLQIGATSPVSFQDLTSAGKGTGFLLDMPDNSEVHVSGLELGNIQEPVIPIIESTSGPLYLNKLSGAEVVIGRNTSTSGINVAGTAATSTIAGSLSVGGNLVVTGSITGATVVHATYQDVAEWVPASKTMTAGTVVVLNRSKRNEVTASEFAYDTAVAGVVSAQPGIVLGVPSDAKAQVATTGRVKVHADAARGAIRVGDLLVTSDKEGTAMRSEPLDIGGAKIHRPGTVIGKALEPLDRGQGDILVLLSLQ